MQPKRGLLFVISGPSGTGKGTICNVLRSESKTFQFSVSATSRLPREGEVEGRDYFFKTREEFQRMIRSGEFIEWTEYCNNYYGTPKKYVDACLVRGMNIILEIEVEGAMNIKRLFPESILIFILPPSYAILKERLVNRGTESKEVIERRLAKARREFLRISEYDYTIVNDRLEDAVAAVESIALAERCRVRKEADPVKQLEILMGDIPLE